MSSFIKVTVISGAQDESHLCYLLEVDEAKILLDCGWNDNFQPEDLGTLKEIAKDVDAVLLSHADCLHMGRFYLIIFKIGAYPYAVAKLGLTCPSYVTVPVHDMGRTFLFDIISSKRLHEDFRTFTFADVENSVSKMTLLRYSQPFSLQGKCQGIIITPFGAGRTIGGTVWRIRKHTENIVYTVDFNHRKERHLNGSVLVSTDVLARPSLLITDSLNINAPIPPPRKERDRELINSLTSTLENNGNVLIPVESTTRVLELSYLLDQHWAYNRLTYHLLFLTSQSSKTINLARSMLEWMGDGISQAFAARELPFDFRYLKCISSLSELESLSGPKVVLCSTPGMMYGFSRELLLIWGTSENNLVVLPERGPIGSVCRELYEYWNMNSSSEAAVRPAILTSIEIPIEIKRSIPLSGEELELYNEEVRQKQELEMKMKQDDQDDDDLSYDEDDDEEMELIKTSYDIYIKDIGNCNEGDSTSHAGGFFKQQNSFKMFPGKKNSEYYKFLKVEGALMTMGK